MTKRERKMLILGLMPGLTRAQVEDARDYIQEQIPEFEVRVVVGLLSAYAFTTEVEDDPVAEHVKGAYL